MQWWHQHQNWGTKGGKKFPRVKTLKKSSCLTFLYRIIFSWFHSKWGWGGDKLGQDNFLEGKMPLLPCIVRGQIFFFLIWILYSGIISADLWGTFLSTFWYLIFLQRPLSTFDADLWEMAQIEMLQIKTRPYHAGIILEQHCHACRNWITFAELTGHCVVINRVDYGHMLWRCLSFPLAWS